MTTTDRESEIAVTVPAEDVACVAHAIRHHARVALHNAQTDEGMPWDVGEIDQWIATLTELRDHLVQLDRLPDDAVARLTFNLETLREIVAEMIQTGQRTIDVSRYPEDKELGRSYLTAGRRLRDQLRRAAAA